jgi:hypothetical protein
VFGVQQKVVALDIEVVDLVFHEKLHGVEDCHEDVQIEGKGLRKRGLSLAQAPLFQTALVGLHDNPVRIIVHAVVVEVATPRVVLEFVEYQYFREDVVQNAPVMNRFWNGH